MTKIEYNGSVVATIPNGNKATFPIADKKMKSDIVITVPETEVEVIPEFTEVEDFTVSVNGLEGEVEISYDVSEKVALPAGSPARLASVSDENFIASNIKKDVSIFGLTGVYEGETVEEYDGTVVIEDLVSLISFIIEETTYQAEEGMTWAEWVESEYNTIGVKIDSLGNVLSSGGLKIALGSTSVVQISSDVIVVNTSYVTISSGGAD